LMGVGVGVGGAQTSPEVQIVEEEKASPPARGRAQQQVNGSARKYRISFSESQSDARALGTLVGSVETPATTASSVPPVQVGRFGVSYPSRMSHSESAPPEPSETREDGDYGPESGSQSSQHAHAVTHDHLEATTTTATATADGNDKGQTRQIRRFIISNADVSADEDPEAVETPQPQEVQQQQIEQVVGGQPEQIQAAQSVDAVQEEWQQPLKDKLQWTAKECSEWVSSLGGKYKQYEDSFIENGIDGEFLRELDSETLSEIVKSGLHRKKILTAWQKL